MTSITAALPPADPGPQPMGGRAPLRAVEVPWAPLLLDRQSRHVQRDAADQTTATTVEPDHGWWLRTKPWLLSLLVDERDL